MQDMSSQMLSNLLAYFFQSHCVLDQDSHTGQSCPWWAHHDAMKVNFALVFSSPDLVSKFIEEFDAAKLVTDSCGDNPWVLRNDSWRCLDLSGGEDDAS